MIIFSLPGDPVSGQKGRDKRKQQVAVGPGESRILERPAPQQEKESKSQPSPLMKPATEKPEDIFF